tara:strand:+ start:320 stop:673 length:354 start_codon:yes stop_codon:yes gene_type:complete
MKISTVSLLLALALPFSVQAIDDEGRLNVHSMGVKPCAKVIDDFQSDGSVAKLLNSVWVAGYLTAINSDVYDGFDVVDGMNAAERDEWLYRYCDKNPEHILYNAASAMVEARGAAIE